MKDKREKHEEAAGGKRMLVINDGKNRYACQE